MMSYIEGDSLLREIEKSLEQEMEEEEDVDQMVDIDDNVEEEDYIDGDSQIKKKQLKEIGGEALEAERIDEAEREGMNTFDKLVKDITAFQGSSKNSQKKSSNFKTNSVSRPSSSFTNQTTQS